MLHNLNLRSHSGPLIMQHIHNRVLLESRKHSAQHIQFWKSGVHSTDWCGINSVISEDRQTHYT